MSQRGRTSNLLLCALGLALAGILAWVLTAENDRAQALAPEAETAVDTSGSVEPSNMRALPTPESEPTAASAPPAGPRTALVAEPDAETVTLTGRVLARESEAPLEDANFEWLDEMRRSLGSSRSDAEGHFQTSVARDKVKAVRVSCAGFVEVTRSVEPTDAQLEFMLDAAGSIVAELEFQDPAAWSEVEIDLWLLAAGTVGRSPLTTRTGDASMQSARFTDLAPGTYAVSARVPEHGFAYEGNLALRIGQTLNVRLTFRRPITVRGRVTFEGSKQPVAGADLTLRPLRQGLSWRIEETLSLETRTAEDGGYRFDGLTVGEHRLSISYAGLDVSRSLELPNSGVDEVRDFELPRPSGLRGQVVNGSDVGVEGIQVELRQRRGGGSWETTTAADGRFEFESLPASRELVARVSEKGKANELSVYTESSTVVLAPGEVREDYRLVLVEPRLVNGIVLDPEGQPVAKARVRVHKSENGPRIPGSVFSADDGTFRVNVYSERAALRVDASGYGSAWKQVPEGEGTEETPAKVELTPVLTLEGRVLDPEGSGIPYARVWLTENDPSSSRRRSRRNREATQTDELGRFRFGGLEANSFRLTAQCAGWIREQEGELETTIPSDEPIVLRLRRDTQHSELSSTVRGRLVFRDGTRPSGVRFEGTQGGLLTLDGDQFEVAGTRSRSAAFIITADEALPLQLESIDLAPGSLVDLGTVELNYATDLRIAVKVKGGGSARQVRADLRVLPADVRAGTPDKRYRIRWDSRSRRYRLQRAPRGEFQLQVRAAGCKPYRKKVTIKEQRVQEIAVELSPDS